MSERFLGRDRTDVFFWSAVFFDFCAGSKRGDKYRMIKRSFFMEEAFEGEIKNLDRDFRRFVGLGGKVGVINRRGAGGFRAVCNPGGCLNRD